MAMFVAELRRVGLLSMECNGAIGARGVFDSCSCGALLRVAQMGGGGDGSCCSDGEAKGVMSKESVEGEMGVEGLLLVGCLVVSRSLSMECCSISLAVGDGCA